MSRFHATGTKPSRRATCSESKDRVISVSIVEDVSELRESMAKFFRCSTGFRFVSAYESVESALQGLPNDNPQVVLMDINLAGKSGIECVSRLKPLMPDTQIVMLTVFEDNESIFEALRAGATGYLLKRQAPEKLLEAIQEVMAGGSPMSTSIARKIVRSFQKPAPQGTDLDRLSPREKQVLDLLARGEGYKQIASELGISLDTVRTYIRRIYEKLFVHTRTQAVAKYLSR
ncbi:MAG TPA: response regulator transcription factor [Verrucomicrobiae bacterium]|nr:response regulator transcription factor [Verrucomicrobiae bacterium]